jgi:hypothetical protein
MLHIFSREEARRVILNGHSFFLRQWALTGVRWKSIGDFWRNMALDSYLTVLVKNSMIVSVGMPLFVLSKGTRNG